jgi:serine protease Do
MNPIRKKLAIAVLSGTSLAGLLAGTSLVRDNSAHAQDNPANPKQGNVQPKAQLSDSEKQQLEGLAGVFRKVGKHVEPAVVQINVKKTTHIQRSPGFDDMLRRMFPDQDGDGKPDVPEGFGGGGDDGDERVQMGTGSGVVMEVNGSDAYILTNNHVAGGATEMQIITNDGRKIENGKLMGADPKSDLAVVKIHADGLVAAPWGDSDKLEKGDWIMAFGSPFGYVGSMTHGIVSALNRQAGILGQNGYENFIQVDAPINPGNSGGPLVNIDGEVVGINTAIASRSGGFQGIGFAIPSNQAKSVYSVLKAGGKVVRGYLGVSIRDAAADPEVAKTFGYNDRDGVMIWQTFKNTPATGKLEKGDIVTGIGGKPVKDAQELRNKVAAAKPGSTLDFTVFRDGKSQDVKIKVGEQPEDMTLAMTGRRAPGAEGEEGGNAEAQSNELFGMTLATPNEELARQYNLGEHREGALVTEVEPKSPAGKAELRKGDLILEVFNTPVKNAKEAADALRKADKTKPIRLYVATGPTSRFVVIKPNAEKSSDKATEK